MSEKKPPINKEETILSKSECSQNVLTNLKILANIKPNDKLSKRYAPSYY